MFGAHLSKGQGSESVRDRGHLAKYTEDWTIYHHTWITCTGLDTLDYVLGSHLARRLILSGGYIYTCGFTYTVVIFPGLDYTWIIPDDWIILQVGNPCEVGPNRL